MILLALTRGQILRHIFLPGIVPRLKSFVSNGFDKLAYFMALVYRAVNILPANHPYTNASNIGRFGVMRVLSEASSHIIFDKHNIDKIIIYFALLMGVFLLAFQFILLLAAIMVGSAAAQIPDSYQGFIKTPNESTDIAFRLLSKVFGIPGLFGPTAPATPTAFHTAMHSLFQYYSTGMLVVAAIIISYFIFVVVAETAQTGTPFGKRFNHVWAPIRLVVAIGLLIPVSYGMNSAQWITLYSAKFGSGFASQGWVIFNESVTESYLGDDESLVATPNTPDLTELATFMMIANACKYAYQLQTGTDVTPIVVDAYLVKSIDGGAHAELSAKSYQEALDFYNDGNIAIRFGEKSANGYPNETGGVFPFCGELVLSTTHLNDDGARDIVAAYYELIKDMWNANYNGIDAAGIHYVNRSLTGPIAIAAPDSNFRETLTTAMEEEITTAITDGVTRQRDEYETNAEYEAQGWAGAGIWYNQVAQVNGTVIAAANNVPHGRLYPSIMEYYKYKNEQANETSTENPYHAALQNGHGITPDVHMDAKINEGLSAIYAYWNDGKENTSGNIFIDVINQLLGTKGLFDMCANADIHPMAQISALGKGLIDSAIINIIGAATGTGLGSLLGPYFGAALGAASSFLFTVASIGILIGFILFYLVPFLPFLYFFFAVGGWIKGLFEAMVGLPLWALAHLRIDGQGLPGDAAINGYFLILEIFIRPILIVFGLLAAVSIFGAMVKVLNEIFYIATSNLAGYESTSSTAAGAAPATATTAAVAPTGCGNGAGSSAEIGSAEWVRGPVDEFFFTIIYAILVYMIGMSTFKLIDMIPNNILRWMGTGVNTYNDQAGETAEGLMQKVTIGGSMISGQVQGALSQGGGIVSPLIARFRQGAAGGSENG